MKKPRPSETSPQRIILYDSSNESASGHTETHRSASLELDSNGDVICHQKYQHLEFLHSQNDITYERSYKIKADKLEELIKEHGKLVADTSKKEKTRHLKNRS